MTAYLFDGSPDAALTVLLAHGAGAPMDSPFLQFFAETIAAGGDRCARFEFPYMARRRTEGVKPGPDSQAKLLDAYREAVSGFNAAKLVIGGKSLGGRIASMVADELGVAGLICLGYPFHAPGRPERPRIDHLRELATPALIVQGTRDPFGSPGEIRGYPLSSAITIHWLEDGDHDFKPRKASGRTRPQNWQESAAAVADFLRQLAP